MIKTIVSLLLWAALVSGLSCWALAEESMLNSDNGLAVHGYDPVSYHKDGPVKGQETWSSVYNGVTYHFASRENLETFKNDPERYLPAYGGWCAWAMLDGEKVDVDPRSYKVIAGRTYLFYNSFFVNTLKKWNDRATANAEGAMVEQADAAWDSLIGQQ